MPLEILHCAAPCRNVPVTFTLELMESAWPFDQPKNCAVVSVRDVMLGNAPVLLVAHDEDDDGWQFLAGGPYRMEDVVLVLFQNVVAKDRTLFELADLRPGWQARRTSQGAPWIRERIPSEEGAP